MADTTRTASTPAAGGVRAGIGVSLASIVNGLLAGVLPAAVMNDVETVVLVVFTAGFAALGKVCRGSSNPLAQVIGQII